MHTAHASTRRPLVRSLACLIVLALSACQSSSPSKGRISDGVYISPHGNFSLPMPLDAGVGCRVQDDARDLQGKEGYLTVSNDFGALRSVQWAALAGKSRGQFESKLPESLDALYRDGVVGVIAKSFPRTRSLHDEPLMDAPSPAHFGVVFIPKGSTLVKADSMGAPTGERPDTVRAYLVFARDGYAYILGCATSADAMKADTTLTPERLDGYKRILGEMRSSMRFAAVP